MWLIVIGRGLLFEIATLIFLWTIGCNKVWLGCNCSVWPSYNWGMVVVTGMYLFGVWMLSFILSVSHVLFDLAGTGQSVLGVLEYLYKRLLLVSSLYCHTLNVIMVIINVIEYIVNLILNSLKCKCNRSLMIIHCKLQFVTGVCIVI